MVIISNSRLLLLLPFVGHHSPLSNENDNNNKTYDDCHDDDVMSLREKQYR
jgi:hypothetical protein